MSDREHEDEAPAEVSAGRRALFWILLGLGLVVFWEAVSFVVFFAIDGQPFSYARLDAERRLLATGEVVDSGAVVRKQERKLTHVLHPYIGFTNAPRADPTWLARYHHPLNAFGFLGADSPIRTRTPDKAIVAITGGSVAAWFSVLGDEELRARLAELPQFRGREIEIVSLGTGSFKQPQQLMAVTWMLSLGAEFDYLVNLDGFNDLIFSVQNERRGVNPSYPRAWDEYVSEGLDREWQARVGRVVVLRDQQRDLAAYVPASPASRSVTLQLLWRLRDRLLESRLGSARIELAEYRPEGLNYAATGPSAEETGAEPDAISRAVRIWADASLQLARLASSNGIAYLHFLQPNQYVPDSKPMGPEEHKVAIGNNVFSRIVPEGYPDLVLAGGALRERGVDFHDLTGLFDDVSEPLYVDDCCHLNEEGNRLLAGAIAAAIAEAPDPRAGTASD